MTDEIVEAVRNRNSGKLFILVDEYSDRYRLVTPEGALVSLPIDLFEEEPILVESEAVTSNFSDAQYGKYRGIVDEMHRKLDMDAAAQKEAAQRQQRERAEPKRVSPRRSPGSRRPKEDNRVGLGASWSATTLAFYRPQIDRLGPKQKFKIQVAGVGDFIISKQDFQAVFSDVVLSAKYKADGFFAYPDIPEKARRFLVEA